MDILATGDEDAPPRLRNFPESVPMSESLPAASTADVPQARTSLRNSLRWFLAEFLVVVAGVLVALAVNGLMQEHLDQQREQVYLRQLSADLGRSDVELSEAVKFVHERALASARVLHRFWREAPAVDESFIVDLAMPRGTRRFRPVLGTAEALGSSGELGLIRSDALRADLLAYVELVRTRLDEITRYDETYYRPGVAMLSLAPTLSPPSGASSTLPQRDENVRARPDQYEREPFAATPADLLASHEVYTGYNFLLTAHRNQAEQYEEILQATRALRKKVEAEIKR